MVMVRGDIWWADLPGAVGSEPAFRRPVLVVQSDDFNRSRIQTVVVVALSSRLELAQAPGNLLLPAQATGLPKDSVANVSQIITLDRQFLAKKAGRLRAKWMEAIEEGLALVLGLPTHLG